MTVPVTVYKVKIVGNEGGVFVKPDVRGSRRRQSPAPTNPNDQVG
jgi:hypothetical protein